MALLFQLANDMHMLVQDCSTIQERARALAARLDDMQRRMAQTTLENEGSDASLVSSDMSLHISHPGPVIKIPTPMSDVLE